MQKNCPLTHYLEEVGKVQGTRTNQTRNMQNDQHPVTSVQLYFLWNSLISSNNQLNQIKFSAYCLPALHKTARNAQHLYTHPEDGNCNVYRSTGQCSTFDTAHPRQLKMYMSRDSCTKSFVHHVQKSCEQDNCNYRNARPLEYAAAVFQAM
jgi:hypothetical protein